jgi:hypothetical protein
MEDLTSGLLWWRKKLIDSAVGRLLTAVPCSNEERGEGGARGGGGQSNLVRLTSDNFGGEAAAWAEQRKRESGEAAASHDGVEWENRELENRLATPSSRRGMACIGQPSSVK